MERRFVVYQCLIITIAIAACSRYSESANSVNSQTIGANPYSIIELSQLIGKNLSSIKITNGPYTIKDTTFEAEDETIWPGKIISDQKGVLAVLETSWIDKTKIESIIVISQDILVLDSLHIGSTLNDLIDKEDCELTSSADGLILLSPKESPNLSFLSFITNDSLILNSFQLTGRFPDSLTIGSIIIKKYPKPPYGD